MPCLDAWERFLHDETLPPLVHAAIAHSQFEAIHPFLDGNGRVGRLLITLLLVARGVIPSPLLYLSAWFEATREEYYARLNGVTERGEWEEWLTYFLRGVALQSEDAVDRIERLDDLLSGWKPCQLAGGRSRLPERALDSSPRTHSGRWAAWPSGWRWRSRRHSEPSPGWRRQASSPSWGRLDATACTAQEPSSTFWRSHRRWQASVAELAT